MDIKLIAMDLDGTALQADHKSFSPRLHTALNEAHARGIAVVPVTGRQYRLLPQPLWEHPVWSGLVVVSNGAQIRELETGRCLYALDIPQTALKQLLALSETLDIPLEFSVEGKLHLTRHSYEQELPVQNLWYHWGDILQNHGVFVESLAPLCRDGLVEKAQLPYIPPRHREAVLEALKSIDVSAVWASDTSMEITHSAATKGNALLQLSRMLKIPLENILAMGDSGNDETMLRRAGLGVAMGNAPDSIKAAADAVTEHWLRDGAALAIEQYVLSGR